jgi:hypothetical protein
MTILIAICASVAEAQAYVYINGPSSVCTNTTNYFYASYDGCSYSYSWYATQNGSTIASGFGQGFAVPVGSSTSTIYISLNAYPYSPGGSCYSSYNSRSVSVGTGVNPGTPSPVSITHVSGYLYDLSTSSSGATSYEWTINSGATIQGSSTGSTIRVLANHNCYFSFQVRGKNTSCGTRYSAYAYGSKTIGAPAAPSYVSTPAYIYKGTTVTVTASNNPPDPGIFEWSLTDPGGRLYLYGSGGTTASLVHNGATDPVIKEAYVNVRRSSACGVSATVQGLTRYGNNAMRMVSAETDDLNSIITDQPLKVYPNPAAVNTVIRVKLPVSKESVPKKMQVLDAAGKIVFEENIQLNSPEEREIKGLASGIYLVTIVNSKNESSVQKLLVR